MEWTHVWLWAGGFVSGVGAAALLDNFLERRIARFFREE